MKLDNVQDGAISVVELQIDRADSSSSRTATGGAANGGAIVATWTARCDFVTV